MANPHPLFEIRVADDPLVATAVHDGHFVRDEVARRLRISEATRMREEDPYTAPWTVVAPTSLVAKRSRFEFDLNRPREKAIYLEPQDAWGLDIWRERPSTEMTGRSLECYDLFYRSAELVLRHLVRQQGRVVVLDLHTYNHCRKGPGGEFDDPNENPEVNLGTGTMDRDRWSDLIDRFSDDLRQFDFLGRRLDVRENVKFRGGHFSQWIHATFPEAVCSISIEFKKFFMDEWTGEADHAQHDAIARALAWAVPGIYESLQCNER
jgi:hypothetical protein